MNEPGTKRGGGGPRVMPFALAALFWLVAQAANAALHLTVHRVPGIDGARPAHAEEALFALASAVMALLVFGLVRVTRSTERAGRTTTGALVALAFVAPFAVIASEARETWSEHESPQPVTVDAPTLAHAFGGKLPRWCGDDNQSPAFDGSSPAALRCTFDAHGPVRQGIVATTLSVGDHPASLTRVCRNEQADKWASCHFVLAKEPSNPAFDSSQRAASPGLADESWPDTQKVGMDDSLRATLDATHGWWVITSSADAGTDRAWVFDADSLEPAKRDVLASDLELGTPRPSPRWLAWFVPLAIVVAIAWRRLRRSSDPTEGNEESRAPTGAAVPSVYRHPEPNASAVAAKERERETAFVRAQTVRQRAWLACVALPTLGVLPLAIAWTWHLGEATPALWRTGAAGHLDTRANPCPSSMRLIEGGALRLGDEPPTTGVSAFCLDGAQVSVAAYRAFVPRNDDILHSGMFKGSCSDPEEHGEDRMACVRREEAAAYCRAKNLRLPTTDEDRFALMQAAAERRARLVGVSNGPIDEAQLLLIPHRACEGGCPLELTANAVVSVECPNGHCAKDGFHGTDMQAFERGRTIGFRCAY